MIKKILLKIRNNILRKKQDIKRYSVAFEDAKTIGILVDNPKGDYVEPINKFVEELRSYGKNVTVVCRIEKSYLRNYSFNYYEFSKKDVDWKGKISNERVNNFTKKEFDYLYCINNSPFLPFENILLRSKAKFRFGIAQTVNADCLELIIQPNGYDNFRDILERMIEFSKKLTN
ncbi:MAG: DUF6913 domain-containing protein [Cytophagaceae bacterium]